MPFIFSEYAKYAQINADLLMHIYAIHGDGGYNPFGSGSTVYVAPDN